MALQRGMLQKLQVNSEGPTKVKLSNKETKDALNAYLKKKGLESVNFFSLYRERKANGRNNQGADKTATEHASSGKE